MAEAHKEALKLDCDRRLKLEFHGTKITSDAGLLAYAIRLRDNQNKNPAQQALFNKELRLNQLQMPNPQHRPKPNQPSSTQELALQSPPRMI